MALSRRAFFGRIAAIAVGSVLARAPQFKSRLWSTRTPTFEHREFYGLVKVSNEMLDADYGAVRLATATFQREMDRRMELLIADMNRDLLTGTATRAPKGILSA